MNQHVAGNAPTEAAMGRLLDEMQSNMKVQLDLCADLEAIADSLPDNLDPQACLRIANRICPAVRAVHEFEEKSVFPLLRAVASSQEIDQTIERLRFEHWEDESFASELQESLHGLIHGDRPVAVDSLAYMLRGFFEGMRRHVAFEREHLMPLL